MMYVCNSDLRALLVVIIIGGNSVTDYQGD